MGLNIVINKHDPYEGYSRYGIEFARALGLRGASFLLSTITETDYPLPPWMPDGHNSHWPTLAILNPEHLSHALLDRLACRNKPFWVYTMYEDTSLPASYMLALNTFADLILVPTALHKVIFADCGVQKPIRVLPGGVNADLFTLRQQQETWPVYTFLCFGDRQPRKGHERAIIAFYRAFGDTCDDVHLVIKTRAAGDLRQGRGQFNDPRIRFWSEDVPSLLTVFLSADCLVYPSYGEGWGMIPRQAACTGMPVLAPPFLGLGDIEHWGYPVNYRLTRSLMPTPDGYWAETDVDHLAQLMVECRESSKRVQIDAFNKAQWLRENQTWYHTVYQFCEDIYDG